MAIATKEIKALHRIDNVYTQLTGNTLKQSGNKLTGLCPNPNHNDHKDGNFFIYPETDSFYCFACSVKGDIVALVQLIKRMSFLEALSFLGCSALPKANKEPKTAGKELRLEIKKELPLKTKEIYNFLESKLSLTANGKNYLLGRGLTESTIQTSKIKSIDHPESIYQLLKTNFSLSDIQSAGLSGTGKNGNDYFIFYKPCIIFIAYKNDEPVYFSSRNLTNDKERRFTKMQGIHQEFYLGDISQSESILIFEGLIDALSYYELSGKSNYIVTFGLNTRVYSRLKKCFPNKSIVIAFDNDSAGEYAKNSLLKANSNNLQYFDYTHLIKELGLKKSYKDLNDILKIIRIREGSQAVISFVTSSLSATDYQQLKALTAKMEANQLYNKPEAEKRALLAVLGEV